MELPDKYIKEGAPLVSAFGSMLQRTYPPITAPLPPNMEELVMRLPGSSSERAEALHPDGGADTPHPAGGNE
jgi:hypothetical protein